jgi:hypothetical protein
MTAQMSAMQAQTIAQISAMQAQTNAQMAAMQAQTNAQMTEMTAMQAQTNAQITAMQAQINSRFDCSDAQFAAAYANCVARRTNHLAVVSGNLESILKPISKEIPGVGAALISAILKGNIYPPAPLADVPALGNMPKTIAEGGCFPGDLGALQALTHAQVLALVQYYNTDFGITENDKIHDRRMKHLSEKLHQTACDSDRASSWCTSCFQKKLEISEWYAGIHSTFKHTSNLEYASW